MKLWIIYQNEHNDYDTYDSAIVAAETLEEAQRMHPNGYEETQKNRHTSSWVKLNDVKVKLIGEAVLGTESGVILASFNAG